MDLVLSGVSFPFRLRLETPLSGDELLRFCADNENLRIERDETGELHVMTPAGNRTGQKNSYIVRMLGSWADADGRGYSFDSNTGFTLPDGSMRSPDAAWCKAARWDAMSDTDKDGFSPICPEFIIELRSQADRLAALQAKMQMWIANGAELAWLIDPLEQAVTVYRPHETPEVHLRPISIHGTGPIDGFTLILDRIWA